MADDSYWQGDPGGHYLFANTQYLASASRLRRQAVNCLAEETGEAGEAGEEERGVIKADLV